MTDALIISISWGIFALITIAFSIIAIIKAKYKDEIITPWMAILVSFTPGIILIGYFILFIFFLMLIIEGPAYIISKIKRL